jgi:hypothetical protein
MGSSEVRINGLSIFANNNTATAAQIGLQIGVTNDAGVTAGDWVLNGVNIEGNYTLAALYMLGSEVFSSFGSRFSNSLPTGQYVAITDGNGHFASQITTAWPFTTTNVHHSNTHIHFSGGRMTTQGSTATPFYISGDTEELMMENVYLNTLGTRCFQINFDDGTVNRFQNAIFHTHCEDGTLTRIFEFTGALTTPTVRNMEWRDEAVFGTGSIIAIGSGGMTSVNFSNLFVDVGLMVSGSETLFDTPANYSVTGNISVPTALVFNTPLQWYGCVYIHTLMSRTCTEPGAPVPGMLNNRWYLSSSGSIYSAGAAVGANVIACTSESLGQRVTIDQVGATITVQNAGNYQLAIYSNVNGRPGARLATTANITMNVAPATAQATALSGSLNLGVGSTLGRDFWVCFNNDNGAGAISAKSSTDGYQQSKLGSAALTNATGAAVTTGVFCSGAACTGGSSTFGTWPVSLAASTWSELTVNAPRVGYHISSIP